MPDQRPDRCETCRYFDYIVGAKIKDGLCRVVHPTRGKTDGRAEWPIIYDARYQWCGEWQAKRGEPTDGDTVR